ncbi:hypothetical protein EVAR_24721_1 [Eumeta japonica]|uniref:Uncharacterized protein n=1 Tax=Eumeta variegata TaxID=151549 RepID=A0A4C1VC49_EUMVA|nr:hypothetical protein EVAR_24721_1 [Eumeta japonica]
MGTWEAPARPPRLTIGIVGSGQPASLVKPITEEEMFLSGNHKVVLTGWYIKTLKCLYKNATVPMHVHKESTNRYNCREWKAGRCDIYKTFHFQHWKTLLGIGIGKDTASTSSANTLRAFKVLTEKPMNNLDPMLGDLIEVF